MTCALALGIFKRTLSSVRFLNTENLNHHYVVMFLVNTFIAFGSNTPHSNSVFTVYSKYMRVWDSYTFYFITHNITYST